MNLLAPLLCHDCQTSNLLDRWQVAEAAERGWHQCSGCRDVKQWVLARHVWYLPDGDHSEEPIWEDDHGRLIPHGRRPPVP